MRRTHKALATLALGLALVGTTTAAAGATRPTGAHDQADQRKALYQSELERNLQQRTQAAVEQKLAAQRKALYQSELERTLARHRALGALDAVAAQPAAKPDPATPNPGVDVLATLLVGLVGGLVGGTAAMLGWTATTHQRRPRAATGT
jgi:hypothetical protein